jgi:acetyltransferase-like isoleucine patch superfamily enzyme
MPDRTEERKSIIKKLFGISGKNFWIEPHFFCDYGYNIEIGENFYANHDCVILDPGKVTFGDNVFIGPNCGFYTAGHPTDVEMRNKGLEFAKPIRVGNNVWIGGNVCVLPNVTIGDNVTIGAGSVVVHDIPSNCVAVGNPCKVVKSNI